jgi:peptidoglycan/xylan/chitin deacetylase (PgdA/CDA1 family)
MSGLSRDQVIAELDEPVATMRRELGRAPISFAYPYGATSELAKELAGARYQHCCTTEFRLLGRREDRRALPRLDMYYWRDRGAIRQLGDSRLQTKVWVRRQARAVKALFDQ